MGFVAAAQPAADTIEYSYDTLGRVTDTYEGPNSPGGGNAHTEHYTYNPDGTVRSGFEERADLFSSVAFWYQQGIAQNLPTLPYGIARLPHGNAQQIEIDAQLERQPFQHGFRQVCFQAVKDWLAPAGRDIPRHALDDPAHAVAVVADAFDPLDHCGGGGGVGWLVPLDGLSYWILGLPAPGRVSTLLWRERTR